MHKLWRSVWCVGESESFIHHSAKPRTACCLVLMVCIHSCHVVVIPPSEYIHHRSYARPQSLWLLYFLYLVEEKESTIDVVSVTIDDIYTTPLIEGVGG